MTGDEDHLARRTQDKYNPYIRFPEKLAFMKKNVKSLKTLSISKNPSVEEIAKFGEELEKVSKNSIGIKLEVKGVDTFVLFFDDKAVSKAEIWVSTSISKLADIDEYFKKFDTDVTKLRVLSFRNFFSEELWPARENSGRRYVELSFYVHRDGSIKFDPDYKWHKYVGS